MASTITKPQVLAMPFCNNGDKRVIPVSPTGNQYSSLTEGFPEITEMPLPNGKPPERVDFNGIGNLLSQFAFAFQNGWWPTFDTDVSTAIGGYALGAVLWYDNGSYFVKSLKANNTDNFVSDPTKIDGVSWQRQTAGLATTDLANVATTLAILNNVMPSGMDYVIESKAPTALDPNGYEVWRSGKIRQYGYIDVSTTWSTVTLSKPMELGYILLTGTAGERNNGYAVIANETSTTFEISRKWDTSQYKEGKLFWEVIGQGATL